MENTLVALCLLERIRKQCEYLDKTALWAANICRKVAEKNHLEQDVLDTIDAFLKKHQNETFTTSDWAFRMCQAHIARTAGFTNRNQWTQLISDSFKTGGGLNE